MPASPTASQIAGQSIGHLRQEWDAKRAQLDARRARMAITFDAYKRQLAHIDKRYGEAIEAECTQLQAAEWSGWREGES